MHEVERWLDESPETKDSAVTLKIKKAHPIFWGQKHSGADPFLDRWGIIDYRSVESCNLTSSDYKPTVRFEQSHSIHRETNRTATLRSETLWTGLCFHQCILGGWRCLSKPWVQDIQHSHKLVIQVKQYPSECRR